MKRILNPLLLLGLGAGAMYFADPAHGRRRRAIVRDKCSSILHRATALADKALDDLSNRTRGLFAPTRGRLRSRPADDPILEARIKAKLGHVVSHPHTLHVRVTNGVAILRGPILADEVKELIAATGAVPGIRAVENQLDSHASAAGIPALQGLRAPARQKFILAKQNWPPAARLVTGTAGTGALLYGINKGGILGKLIACAGGALVLRAATNLDASRLTGIGAGTRAIDLRKTITINTPIDEVFNFWANFQNLPRFMTHVREVQTLGNGRSHWIIAGPAGAAIQWTARETEFVPYQILAWETEPGSSVDHTGLVRFAPTSNGGTRLDIFMSYNPIAGAIGHLLARLFGSDPKRTLDRDLVRFKSLMERPTRTGSHRPGPRDNLIEGP